MHARWEAYKLWQQGESDKWLNFLPWFELPREMLNEDVRNYLNNPSFEAFDLPEGCKDISVPNCDITGWYDCFCDGDMLMFRTMVNKAKTKVARKGTRIIIGPWSHKTNGRRRVGDFDFGPDASLDVDGLIIRWFDYWLKGKQNGMDREPQLKIFVMGDNEWRDEQCWPLQQTQDKILFMTGNGHANTPSGDGKLAQQEPKQAGKDQYLYDPKDPVPTLFDQSTSFLFPNDQRSLADREDILVYQSEPLTERVEVTGNPVVEFYAASSAPDTDWFVRLIDVAPDGLARNISEGAVRARYRNGFDRPKLLKPGEVLKYTIRMKPTSNAFLAGHRIRIDITSSDFPNCDRNHNTAADQNADATLLTTKQTIYHGGERATRIILPWVPNPAEEERSELKPEKQMYPLHQAAADGDIEQAKQLISKGADVNSEDGEGKTPLQYAVKSGKMGIVRLLVEAEVDVNAGSWPPLSMAVDENNTVIAEYLIDHGANVNAPEGWTALQETPYIGNNIEMVELLIANGADINVKDGSGKTLLAYDLLNDMEDIARLILERTTDFTSKDNNGLTTLHYAAVNGSPKITELLLAKGAKVDERDDNYEFTALHYAARFGNKNVAEVLIANGADIEAKDKWGYEPIHWAAYHDRPDIVELLIDNCANVNVKTSLGQTPLQLAQERRNTKTVELLRKYETQK